MWPDTALIYVNESGFVMMRDCRSSRSGGKNISQTVENGISRHSRPRPLVAEAYPLPPWPDHGRTQKSIIPDAN